MRKIPRGLVGVIGVALLATACGGGGDDTSAESEATGDAGSETGAPVRGDEDLVIWTDNEKVDGVKEIADKFAADNGITVAVQVVSANLQTNFVTANTAGNGPDVVVGAHDWIGNMVQNGAIDPLQITADQLSGYSPKAIQATTYNGQLYGLPYGVEGLALYRNTDVAPDAPVTLDAAFAAGEAAKAAGTVESAFNLAQGELGDAYHMQPILTSMGGFLFGKTADGTDDPTQLGIGQPGSIAAAQKISELGETGSGILRRSISTDNTIALFAEGKAAFLVSGPWALRDVKAGGVNYAITPIPGFEGQQPAKPFMGAQAFFVASQGKNKAFAQEFVTNGANTEEAMTTMFELTQLPPSMTAVRQAIAADNPDIEVFAQAAEAGDPMPAIPAMAKVWEPLGKAYAAIIGGSDPTTTMTDTGATIQAAIAG